MKLIDKLEIEKKTFRNIDNVYSKDFNRTLPCNSRHSSVAERLSSKQEVMSSNLIGGFSFFYMASG